MLSTRSMKKAYLDNAATTPVDPRVLQAMLPYLKAKFGNPSSVHAWGQEARRAVDKAREQVAKALGASPKEIVFTGGSTEAINLAHKGLIEGTKVRRYRGTKLPHVITSRVEHKAVLETCRHLEKLKQAAVTYLLVDRLGLTKIEDVKGAIRPETVLASVMYVNNEVGTIQPIEAMGRLIQSINNQRSTISDHKIFFHTDATQAIQYLNCNVNDLGVDLLSLSGHKFCAPKGIGALFISKGMPLARQQNGGGQEYRLRSGTENVAGIVGLGKAIELAINNRQQTIKRVRGLGERLINGVLQIPDVELTGHPDRRAPHIASFVVKGVEGEAMLLLLSEKGIAASSGSACTSGILEPSHVLTAMGISPELAHGSLRFSLGKNTTQEDINYVIETLPGIIKKLRKMAPKLS